MSAAVGVSNKDTFDSNDDTIPPPPNDSKSHTKDRKSLTEKINGFDVAEDGFLF